METIDTASGPRGSAQKARFVEGSLLRHILVMTGTGAVGLVAIFIGDLANILFLSWLKDEAVVAAVGYASSILFFTTSIGIGLSIAATALVSPRVGAGDRAKARRYAASAMVLTVIASAVLTLAVWLTVGPMLTLLGATGRTHALASSYLSILVPFLPPLALAMTTTAVLRSVGDARRAMNVTLVGAFANLALDPVLIFGLGLGIEGAAIASSLARLSMAVYGLYATIRVHDIVGEPSAATVVEDAAPLGAVAIPAVLTNIATPVGNAYVTAAIAVHGDSAVAAWAIIGRVMPVAFGSIYALSGAIGPVIGQNFGAGQNARMRRAFTLSLWVTAGFTFAAWIALLVLEHAILAAFHAEGETAHLISVFCRYLSPLFLFLGFLFVANAAFNTLGKAQLSTMLNWARATIGTVPFVEAGSRLGGAEGVLGGNMLGGIAFGLLGVWLCFRLMDRIGQDT
ncbi:MAG: MATE family efflux transporter [Hyphomicrobium sp.]|nr:MATE family efflux transporter [Hyphomicrobium sp.]